MLKTLVVCISVYSIFGYSAAFSQKTRDTKSISSKGIVKYVFVDNRIDPSRGVGDAESRFVEVLIDNKSFGKQNLIDMFRLVSKRFENPVLLFVNVFTRLNDIQTPEERDLGGNSDDDPVRSTRTPRVIVHGFNDRATFVRRSDGTVRLIMNYRNGESEISEFKE